MNHDGDQVDSSGPHLDRLAAKYGPYPPLLVVHPCFLIANGDSERVEVLRSPLVEHTKRMYQPVRQYIAEHGLVLAARESFDDTDWMGGGVEIAVYVPPAVRNGLVAGSELSLPWFASAALLTEKHD